MFSAALILGLGVPPASAGEAGNIPVPGMVTLVVLGTPSCPPCVRMKPILEKLAGRYAGRAAIIPIDVGMDNEQRVRFGVKVVPMEVFFDAAGRETYRQVGFMDEKSILDQLKKLGLD
jgi:thioredoxin 1